MSPALTRQWVVPLSTIAKDEDVMLEAEDLTVEATTDGKAIVVLHSYVVPATKKVHNEKGVRLYPVGRFVATGYYGADDRRVIDPVSGDTVFAGPTSLERTAPADLIYKAAADGTSWRLYLDDLTAVTHDGLLQLPNGRPLGVPFKTEYGHSLFPMTPKVDPVSRTILNTSGTLGLNVDTAEVRWKRDDKGDLVLCAAGSGKALILAHHNQWVLIDAATGDQISYLSGTKGCPDVLGTIGLSDGGAVHKLFDSRD